jgi:SEC-C motif
MLGQYFSSLPPDRDRHHAIVGAGWTDEALLASRTPCLMSVSNSLDEEVRWQDVPSDDFQVTVRPHDPSDPISLLVAGVELDETTRVRLHARLLDQVAASPEPAPVGAILVETIRQVAQENRAVGSGVMVNCLPIAPGPSPYEIHLIAGPPRADVRTFSYVPPDQFEHVLLGPLIVGTGGIQLGEFRSEGGGLFGPQGGTTGIMYTTPEAPPQPRGAVGQAIRVDRPGRNDPCWCGSGRKYKKCHGP